MLKKFQMIFLRELTKISSQYKKRNKVCKFTQGENWITCFFSTPEFAHLFLLKITIRNLSDKQIMDVFIEF